MVKAGGGKAGLLADLGAANEALQAVGIHTPFDVKNIPVIGPIASAYLKLRAALTVARKAGFRVPLVGDAAVAAGSSRARDRVAESVEKMLAGGARAAGRANTAAGRMGAVATLPRAAEALRARLYDDGQKRPAPKSDVDALRARLAELDAATANPAGVAATVRANLRGVQSAGVVDAVPCAGTVSAGQMLIRSVTTAGRVNSSTAPAAGEALGMAIADGSGANGTVTADDISLRISADADGDAALARAIDFAAALSSAIGRSHLA